MRRLRRTLVQPVDYRSGPKCLNHLERCALIESPWPQCRVIPSDKSWAGAYIRDKEPTVKAAMWRAGLLADEELVRSWDEDGYAVCDVLHIPRIVRRKRSR